MTQAVEKILSDAMSLNESERAELAAKLIETLDPETEMDADYLPAWEAEIQKRLGELDRGEVKAVPWEEAIDMIGHSRTNETR